MSERNPDFLLKKYWSYDSFRPLQKDIVDSIIEGKDTFALLPTGGGKSVCYQIPALALDGLCIVISPLISLMKDQVEDLKSRGIKSMYISSSMSRLEIDHALDSAAYGDFKLLYVSPERIQTEIFIERFRKMNVSFIAVDESHCISQWGYDFRPSYLNIKQLREIKQLPVLALTATATPEVVTDIIDNLELKDVKTFSRSFKRDNITFDVIKTENKFKQVIRTISSYKGSGIIYVRNRKRCKEISDILNNEGIKSLYYHAGLSNSDREDHQNSWMKNECRVIVATNAFGMGIDKSDVRYVIHWDIPDNPEAFYQEAGRAGRDGQDSLSLLLYSQSDIFNLRENFNTSYPSIEQIRETYLELANYFQLASGSGMMENFHFNLQDFCERFKKQKVLTYNSLTQLEKEGLISMSQGLKFSSTIEIHGRHDQLLNFRSENKSYDEFIAYLLRAFSGILDGPVKIDESRIAKDLGLNKKEVSRKLNYLNQVDLLTYQKGDGEPLITYLQERKDSKNLSISSTEYTKRKESQRKRLEEMISYVEERTCHIQFILKYFGEKDAELCGKCDVCRSSESTSAQIESDILDLLRSGNQSLDQIIEKLPNHSREEVQNICQELLRGEVIKMPEQGTFSL